MIRWAVRLAFLALLVGDLIHGYPDRVYASVAFLWAMAEVIGWAVWLSRRRERWYVRDASRPHWTEL